MAQLLTFVNDGNAPLTKPRYPFFKKLAVAGIRPLARDTLRYSSAHPSRHSTAIGRAGGAYVLLFTVKGFVVYVGACKGVLPVY